MKKINLARIIQRITDKFDLTEYVAEPLLLSETVVMTTNADELLKTTKIGNATQDISSGTSYTTYFTVPAGKKWRIKSVKKPSTTGTTAMYVFDLTGTGIRITSNGTSEVINTAIDIVLETGWLIKLQNTANGADTAVNAQLIYEEEDAY